jgi:uncharacterized protein YcnI
MKTLPWIAALALAAAPAAGLAHVTASPSVAETGAYTQTAFRVGHGCEGGLATTGLRIAIPAGLDQARPRPVPGWTIAIEKAPDGKTTAVSWRGRLADAEFQMFELLYRAPDQPGPLTFAVVQSCGAKRAEWNPVVQVGAGAAPADPHAGHH